MRLSLIKPIMIVVVLGGGYAFYTYDRATNYELAQAIVTDIEETCYLTKQERGALSKTTYTTDPGPCDEWKSVKENHPAYGDFRLVRSTNVTFDYISPVNGEYYSGTLKQAKHKDGSWIRKGDRLDILAHTSVPEKHTKF